MRDFEPEVCKTLVDHVKVREEREERVQKRLDQAKTAAYAASNRVYHLTSKRLRNLKAGDPQLKYFVLGCQGNAKDAQKQVADLMADIAADSANRPDFILITGDNFYDWGIGSANDPAFKTNFEDIYAKLKALGIPCFVILGNHDENLHNLQVKLQHLPTTPKEKGISRGMHQVIRSYLPEIPLDAEASANTNTQYRDTESKVALYENDTLDLDELPLWNMPSRFYSLVAGNYQLFCIDSNTYAADFLEYLAKGDQTPANNQARWLAEQMAIAKKEGRTASLALHHPPFTPGKRDFHSDIKLYLEPAQIEQLKTDFPELMVAQSSLSYNKLMQAILARQQLYFDSIFAAHDHDIYYYNNTESTPNPSALPNRNDRQTNDTQTPSDLDDSFTRVDHSPEITKIISNDDHVLNSNDSSFGIVEREVQLMNATENLLSDLGVQTTQEIDLNVDTEKTQKALFLEKLSLLAAKINTSDSESQTYSGINIRKNEGEIDYPLCLITSGGGGGGLQDRLSFKGQHLMGCFLKRHGFTDVKVGADGTLHFVIRTTDNQQLEFTNKSKKPIRYYPKSMSKSESDAIKKFCRTIRSALNDYFDFIGKHQEISHGTWLGFWGNLTHGQGGVERAHSVWSYISHSRVDDFATTVNRIKELTKRSFTTPTEHSLLNIINKKIAKDYGTQATLDNFLSEQKDFGTQIKHTKRQQMSGS